MASKQDAGNSLDLVDIQEIRDDVVILKDKSLRQVIMVGGVNFALKSDTEQTIMIQAYQNFLNSIEFPLQIVIHSRKVNIDKYADSLLARKNFESSPIIQNQIDEYVQFIRGFVEKNAIMEKMFLVVVPFYPLNLLPQKSGGIFSMFGKKKGAGPQTDGAAEEALKENVAQLKQRTEQVTGGLVNIGVETTVLAADALVELFYNFYNPQTVERQGVVASETLHA